MASGRQTAPWTRVLFYTWHVGAFVSRKCMTSKGLTRNSRYSSVNSVAYCFKTLLSLFVCHLHTVLWLASMITMVRKTPNSGSRSTTSPSVKTNCGLRSFLQARIMAICWAATDSTGSSIRLNSSKQPHEPDCAKPASRHQVLNSTQIY